MVSRRLGWASVRCLFRHTWFSVRSNTNSTTQQIPRGNNMSYFRHHQFSVLRPNPISPPPLLNGPSIMDRTYGSRKGRERQWSGASGKVREPLTTTECVKSGREDGSEKHFVFGIPEYQQIKIRKDDMQVLQSSTKTRTRPLLTSARQRMTHLWWWRWCSSSWACRWCHRPRGIGCSWRHSRSSTTASSLDAGGGNGDESEKRNERTHASNLQTERSFYSHCLF